MIDYARMKKSMPKLKAALTRAKKQGPEAVLKACDAAFAEFDAVGAWPDNWHVWNIAKQDALFAIQRGKSSW